MGEERKEKEKIFDRVTSADGRGEKEEGSEELDLKKTEEKARGSGEESVICEGISEALGTNGEKKSWAAERRKKGRGGGKDRVRRGKTERGYSWRRGCPQDLSVKKAPETVVGLLKMVFPKEGNLLNCRGRFKFSSVQKRGTKGVSREGGGRIKAGAQKLPQGGSGWEESPVIYRKKKRNQDVDFGKEKESKISLKGCLAGRGGKEI